MKSILRKIAFGCIAFALCPAFGQELSIDILQQGETYEDSSYYDILQVHDEYWIAGKYGTLKKYTAAEGLSNITYPSEEVDIYKMDRLGEDKIIASGDKGTVYIHDLKSKTWQTTRVKGYENACFYNLAVMSESKIYISGGNSKIAHSKKTIPEGFILESNDGGITWSKIYSNPLKMVWCVKKNPFDEQMYALMYTINRTHLYKLVNGDWEKVEKVGNSIFHEIQFESPTSYVATGGWIGKKGRIHYNNRKVAIQHSGLIWGRTSNEKYEIYPACDGQIVLGNHKGNYKLFGKKLNKQFSIYEVVFTSEREALAIGSARTLLKLKIEDSI
ncbi:hypothetical protein SAMN06298216_2195 [Spirosomataceae bacterium TFI 002]|nr:hypothetical protein SAMN06298216_2195 [Spirosomataceae bacterium TFI 002]